MGKQSNNTLRLQISTNDSSFVRDYIELLNGIFKLTNTEIDILVEMIAFDSKIPCSTESRKHVVDQLEFKNTAILNNYIRSLKNKGAIQEVRNRLYKYNNLIVPSKKLKQVVVQFNKNGVTETTRVDASGV